MTKESIIKLQKIDCNCNDCKFLIRDLERYNSFNHLYTNQQGHVEHPSYRPQYGKCTKFNKEISFIPNTCQVETQECFEHRKE